VSGWRATKAKRVLAALERKGWTVKREAKGSHKVLAHPDFPDFVWGLPRPRRDLPQDALPDREAHRARAR
jgi:predicted RNA binding protein YcfA (HicA-like mRNA interferase family)